MQKLQLTLVQFCDCFPHGDHPTGLPNFYYHTWTDCAKESHYLLIMLIRCCWSVTARLKFLFCFVFVQRVQSSIICPRCQIRCQNMIMRLHTFSGDSCGKTRAVETDETNFTDMKSSKHPAVRPARLRGADSGEAKKPRRTHGLLRTEISEQIINGAALCSSSLSQLFIGE